MSSSDSETTSASDSDSEAENGLQHANVSTAGPNLAAQSGAWARQHLAEAAHVRSHNTSDLHSSLAAIQLQYLPHPRGQSIPSTTGSSRSATSSMAVSAVSRSTAAGSVASSMHSASTLPSLSDSFSTIKTSSYGGTARTDSSILRQHYRIRDEESEETSEEEISVRLECFFGFLRCPEVFDDLTTWDHHCRSHYRSKVPSTAICPFAGCDWKRSAQHDPDVWQKRLRHMKDAHGDKSYAYPRARPSSAVLEQLRLAGIIDTLQYQELRRDGRLGEQSVLYTASRREDRRQRR